MAVTSQEIQMLGCDSEGCEIEAPAVGGKIPEKFEAGFVHLRHLDDEPVAWVACRKTHIAGAVVAAKARALTEAAPEPEAAQAQPVDDEPERGEEDPEVRRRHEEEELEALEAS